MDEDNAADLGELKEWLRIDDTDDDTTLKTLIISSRQTILNATNVSKEDISKDKDAFALYKLLQKLIITDLYENRSGSANVSPIVIGYYAQLEAYKLQIT